MGPPGPPLAVISPHLDDAALSCADLILAHPGAVAITLFAGARPSTMAPTDWDRACGFGVRDDVMAVRRREDQRGLALLRARPMWLDFPDVAYRQGASDLDAEAVVKALTSTLERLQPKSIAIPVGLWHEDHLATHGIAVAAARAAGFEQVVLYADYYHIHHPETLPGRLTELRADGVPLAHHPTPPCDRPAKRRAIRAYRSQVRGLGRKLDRWASEPPEQYWSYRLPPLAP